MCISSARVFVLAMLGFAASGIAQAGELAGVVVTPHRIEETLRYRRPRDPGLAARVQLFVQGPARPASRFDGKSPAELLTTGDWAWHDLATALDIPEGALAVWTFNGKSSRWGVGQTFDVEAEGLGKRAARIEEPRRWISSVTFLGETVFPDKAVVHFANTSDAPFNVRSLRFWLPRSGATWQTLHPGPSIDARTTVPPGDKSFVRVSVPSLPLTYAALEVSTDAGPLWAHLRVKRESFDISGGWINDTLTNESYLKMLKHLYVNVGQIEAIPGYTDNPALHDRYPIKLFNRLRPAEKWDTDAWLPRIHAVEFLGEPQFGGGRPMSPQKVFDELLPYRAGRLATSVTLSDERTWRWYAGLSDFPHYDAYRVVAPAADAWGEYDRWGGRRIRWGAPLETIGDLCRSLRDLNRPVPCAAWSQGPHDGWGGGRGFGLGGGGARTRRSPTPDELRAQALHALSTRITSLYWFNLSWKSLRMFPDTWEPITRIGREIRMLESYYLEGDAYRFERKTRADGMPDWDLASIAAPEGVLLFALDTSYIADPKENAFTFGPPRPVEFTFSLPPWLRNPARVVRIDADGVHPVKWELTPTKHGVVIHDERSRDAIYLAARAEAQIDDVAANRNRLIDLESKYPIDREAILAGPK